MSATMKQTNKKQISGPGLRPEKGQLTPDVKIANEIVCDHVWDKLYPISVTHSKLHIWRDAFVLGGHHWDVNLLSHCWPA
jgi:hypothetical protein